MGLPLEGIKVVELAQMIAGGYAGQILEDLGADVIKVEPPTGDILRQYVRGSDCVAPMFLAFHHSKRSIAINVKEPRGAAVVRELVKEADVLGAPGFCKKYGMEEALDCCDKLEGQK